MATCGCAVLDEVIPAEVVLVLREEMVKLRQQSFLRPHRFGPLGAKMCTDKLGDLRYRLNK